MTAEFLQSSPMTSQEKKWVVVNSASKPETKLLFNEAIPACVSNRATLVNQPTSIVIEKLLPPSEEHNLTDNTKSSVSFTVLSEERLHAAVKLAKRDLRQRRLESRNESPPKLFQKTSFLETSDVELQQLCASPSIVMLKTSSTKERVAKSRHKLSGHASHKTPITPRPSVGLSPPTRDPGPKQKGSLNEEIHRLQHGLDVCIQKAEELSNRGETVLEQLEPEEQSKLNMRKQKQAARSASIIYVLKQQVKEIQEHLDKGYCHKTKPEKSTALYRLAAVYRGALRALTVFMQQLSDTTPCNSPPNFKDLGQLIRQLCLCSAKVEVDKDVPESALDILQKLETLDSALGKQEVCKKMQVQACPPHSSISPISAPRDTHTSAHQVGSKLAKPQQHIKGKKMKSKKPRASYPPAYRRDVLRAGLERLAQQREQEARPDGLVKKTIFNKGKNIDLMKHNPVHHAGFHQPTVSSRLRVNQVPQKDNSVPWIPTSPHSPPRQRSLQQRPRPEPRCLFSPEKIPQNSNKHTDTDRVRAEPSLKSEKRNQAQEEALRRVWLDKMTMQRLRELHQLSEEEKQHIQNLRSKLISPTRWAERAEQKATENILPFLDQAEQIGPSSRSASSLNNRLTEHAAHRSAESAEQLSEALLEDLVEDTARAAWAVDTNRQLEGMAQRRMHSSTLETMLLRMEEIQRDQEEVRRRVTSIIYVDPCNWDKPENTGQSRPSSPRPIQLTRPVLHQTPAADIILQKPMETGVLLESRQADEEVEQQVRFSTMFPVTVQRSKSAVISVPSHTLRNIRQYREDYEAYQRAVAHKAAGGINPWAIADSLAEELLSEALGDVAAEFQDVVEEYAEAVFTSEFLQPVQSPPPSTQPITGQ